MEARARLFGHPIHQMLVVFALGLLGTSLFFDLIALAADRPALLQASFYMTAAGILGGLAAAVFGLIDFLSIPAGTRAKRIGRLHGIGNVILSRSSPAGSAASSSTVSASASMTVLTWTRLTRYPQYQPTR